MESYNAIISGLSRSSGTATVFRTFRMHAASAQHNLVETMLALRACRSGIVRRESRKRAMESGPLFTDLKRYSSQAWTANAVRLAK